jgi:hypothetical protein
MEKPLPFFLVKKTIDLLWRQYGKVDVFLMENSIFIFRFADEHTKQAVDPLSLGTRDAAVKALFEISSDLDQVESHSDGILEFHMFELRCQWNW